MLTRPCSDLPSLHSLISELFSQNILHIPISGRPTPPETGKKGEQDCREACGRGKAGQVCAPSLLEPSSNHTSRLVQSREALVLRVLQNFWKRFPTLLAFIHEMSWVHLHRTWAREEHRARQYNVMESRTRCTHGPPAITHPPSYRSMMWVFPCQFDLRGE